jgi:hypothetical protein
MNKRLQDTASANALISQAIENTASSPLSMQLKKTSDKEKENCQSSSPMSQNFISTNKTYHLSFQLSLLTIRSKEGSISPMSANKKAPLSPMSLNKAKKESQLSPLSALRIKEGSDDSIEGTSLS